MSKTYKAVGINLKTQAFGESDRLVTILTREFGLIKAIAPGARKHQSSLGGRSGVFVANELLIAKGRSLDKITQAQTIKSYPGLAKDLGKLAASQYLAEIVLCQALSEQPQEELYEILSEHLSRLEALPNHNRNNLIAHLSHCVFHLLSLAGLTPQIEMCCLTGRSLMPNLSDPNWRVGFSVNAGGTVCLSALQELRVSDKQMIVAKEKGATYSTSATPQNEAEYETVIHQQETPVINARLNAIELSMLQQLPQPEIILDGNLYDNWLSIEQILRSYAQYHFGYSIRSAALIDSYFAPNHDAIF
jgi:DNA repair protein RecO (recombination protein O)